MLLIFFIVAALIGTLLPIFGNERWTSVSIVEAAPSTISGTVFKDFNANGTNDSEPGIADITVTLYAPDGTSLDSTTTTSNGSYTLNTATDGPYRIEFTGLPSYLAPSVVGTNSASTVQFVPDGNSTDIDLALHNPAEYCEANPNYGVPCYVNGDPTHASNIGEPAVAQFEYADRTGLSANTKNAELNMEDVGSLWGMAYESSQANLYMSALLKRHVGIGPSGIGAIYVQTDVSDANTVSLFYDFGAAAGVIDDNATRFPGSGNAFGEEGPCQACDNVDPDTFPLVGTAGFGDIDLAEDGSELHVVNLFDRKVYAIDLPDGNGHTELTNAPWTTGDICGGTGVARPWGLKNYNGETYVGLVCDGSTSTCSAAGGACSDLTAHVYAHDGSSWRSVTSFALDYQRSLYNATASSYWHKWASDYSTIKSYIDNQTDAQYPQPLLSDIEFDDDGSMILGFMDRSSLQFGYAAPDPTDTADQISERYFSAGDILRVGFDNSGTAANHSTTYQLENNGTVYAADGTLLTGSSTNSPAGPGGREFYADEWTGIGAGNKSDSGIGSLALKPGTNEVMMIASDAFAYYGAGVMIHNSADGSFSGGVQVYSSDYNSTDGLPAKAGGLGDLELFCEAASLEIGNRVWEDADRDGIQDAGETGISGVTVELYTSGGTFVASAVTDANGNYIFNDDNITGGLTPNSDYELRLSATQPNLLPYAGPSPANVGGASDINDQSETSNLSDSNGTLSGTTVIASITTGRSGQNNHTYDFGFTTTSLSLGDLVWGDTDNDGIFDGVESGISGVTVELYRRGQTAEVGTPVMTTTTNGDGRYLFTDISQGQYFVHIPSTNFIGGGPLNGQFSSTPTEPNPDSDINEDNLLGGSGDDNGINDALPGTYGTSSGIVTLSDDGEPTGEDVDAIDSGTDDNDSNLSVDFGFNTTAPPTVELGDRIWHDANNDGIFNVGESGLSGVEVELYRDGQVPGTDTPVRTTTTDGNGNYIFSFLNPDSYFVFIPASEFGSSEPLEGMLSTIPTKTNPNSDENDEGSGSGGGSGDDNGLNDSDPATNGIRTGIIVLAEGTEPTSEDVSTEQQISNDNDSNLTLDLGFFTPVSIGNYVWEDLNMDGIQNEGPAYDLSGRTVELFLADGFTPATDVNGNTVSATLTDGNGEYLFSNLPPGEYVVRVDLPTGFTPSPGGDDVDSNDSNSDSNGIASGDSHAVSLPVTLTSGGEPITDGDSDSSSNLSVDFGLIPTPDMIVTKTVSPADPVSGGETVEYTIEILNTGYTTLTNVIVSDTLPSGLTHVGGSTTVIYWDGAGNGAGSGGGDTSYFVQDDFSSVAYNNNTGGATGSWASDWIETNDDGSPVGGANFGGDAIFVATSGIWGYQFCTNANADNCLEFDLITTAAGNGARIERAIDLSSASAVTITYDHAGNSTGDVYFETFPDANGNANWVTQETHASGSSKTIVITDPDQLAANAAVRFRINNDSGDDFTVDNFQIDWVEPGVSPPAGYTSVTGGNPPNLTSSSTYTIPVGRYITVTYQATVDNPIAGGTFQFLNEVSVDSTQMDPITDTATLPANGAADYGDLPNGYGTLSASSGASHTLDGTTFLGSSVDGESDGVPGNQANGDDSASSPDDEDGVVFVTPIQPNRTFTIEVTAGGDGVLNAWIDYNADGTLTQIVNEQSLTQGVHTLSFTAPANTTVDDTIYSRFRFSASTGQVTGPSGTAASGEVEDYALLAIGDTVWIDLDADGTQDGGSEVGIAGVVVNLLDQFGQPVTDGAGTPITTTTDVSGNYGFAGLSAGDYIVELDASNWTSGNVFGTGGTYAGAVGTPTQGGDDGTNTDDNGNNDLGGAGVGIQSGVISLALGTEPTTDGDSDSNTDLSVDFGLFQPNEYGDLPDIYGTTLANNGAAHVNDGSTLLGSTIDQEGDGTPTDDAEGDDDATGDDEDGITFLTPLIPGEPAIIEVEAGSNGYLHAWIDFDADGTLDPVNLSAVNGSPTGGSINDLSLTTGTYTLTIIVPATTTITDTIYSRFRYTANDTAGTLGSTGIWPNGEVEDYALMGLGDVVWFDVDNGGDQDVAELRLENIVLNLLDGSGDPLTDGDGDPIQTTTDSSGNYYFGGLPEGSYIVELDYSNWEVGGLFGPGGLYAGAVGSSGSGGDDGDNTDDNGDKDGQTVTITNTIRSGVVALDLGTESTTDGDSNANTDFTIDFGIFLQQYDYGDLPNSYGTTLAESGARHLQTSITYLGSGVDAELDGNPTVDATGDDTYTITVATGDDEDGIIFTPLSPGQTAIVTVTAGTDGYLNGWIDFDADGTLDPISIVSGPGAGGTLSNVNLTAGVYALEISVPATMTVDSTIYSRFRFTANSGEVTGPTGTANSGEVEDYALSAIGNTVWYDRNNDGTQDVGEVGIPNVVMNLLDGSGDPVLDGSGSPLQTTTDANGNYGFAGLPDGDFIVQIDPSNWNGGNVFGSGGPYEGASNVAGAGGGDNADDQDNSDDNGDNDGVVGPAGGVRSGVISIDLNSEPTGDGDNDPNTDLTIDFGFFYTSYDYGDLPEGAYNTTDGNSGANHLIVGDIYLGNGVDADGDGQPSDAATNDDSDGNDDEDGVLFFTPLHPGRSAEIRVYANADGYLSSFIDFDADGTLDNVTYTSLDAVITPTTSLNNTFLSAGWHTFFIDVPANTVISDTIYSRFRFTGTGGQATTATGSASSGEVEDYPLGSIGNRVWADVNNNGTQDGGEVGISGVIMELWGVRDADGYYITTTTDINGNYYFGGLPEGDYTVQVHEDNWLAGGVFGSGGSYDGWVGSTGQGGDDRVDTDDNGNNDGGQNPAGDPSVYSNAMTLTLGTEVSSYTTFTPTVDTDFKDFTIDFGFSELIDLGVDKSINDLTPTVGDTITFTIAITNAGPSTATGVEITDTLPSGYTFSSASATEGSYDNLTGVWSTLTLTATERQTLTIAATVNATGVYTNYVQVGTANQGDSDSTPGDDSTDEDDDDSVTPVPIPLIDLELDKSINDLTPNIGSNITFTINITNNGPSTATNVTVTDTLPSGYTFVSASATEGSYSNATALWTGLELAAGESQGLSIVATVNPAGDYTNYAEVETATENDVDSTPGDDSTDQDDDDSVTPSPVPVADLSLSKNVSPTTVIANGTVTFTLNITNAGPSVANNVVVTDVLPSGFSFVSAVPSEGSYDDTTGGWSGLTLAATEVQTLTIVATANASGDHTNYAQVSSSDEGDIDSTPGDDSTSDDDDDTATVTLLEYDLALIKEAVTAGPFIVGDQITFTISISNQGDIDSGNFTVVDTLPAELTYLSASPAPAAAPTVGQTGSVTWTDSALAAGDLTTYTISVEVGSLPTTTIKNIAEITVDSGVDSDSDPTDGSGATDTIDDSVLNDNDPGDEDDSDFEEVDIVEYDLALIKETVSPAPFVVGDQITFTLSISNQGDFDSGNFTVVDTLPAELTYLSASPARPPRRRWGNPAQSPGPTPP